MTILLFTLLAIALSITIAGLLLSPGPRFQKHKPREMSHALRNNQTRRMSANRPMRAYGYVQPYPLKDQPRARETILASLNVGRVFRPRPGEQTPWLGLMLILIVLFGFGLLLLSTMLPHPGLIFTLPWSDTTVSAPTTAQQKANSPLFPGLSGASKALVRINQLDPAQYYSVQDYNMWAYSTCSAASMTEVINAYGHHYRLADILSAETSVHAITADQGLLEPTGIDRTVARFHFQATHLNQASLDDVLNIAGRGRPVIVDFPPDRWAGGHILVVIGGNDKYVYLADSSRLNMQAMARAKFLQYWANFAVVVTPM